MATQSDAFQKRERAAEEVFFRQEERLHMLKRLEALVKEGKLEASVLDQVKLATSPDVHHVRSIEASPGEFRDVATEVKKRTDYVFEHVPGQARARRESEEDRIRQGMPHVDLGPSKWSPGGEGGASIFSLSQSLAEGAVNPNLPPHEAARLARLQKAAGAVEMPTLFGYKLAPGLTPGRAFFWGSVLAIWGTAALVAASARGLGPVRSAEEAAAGAREPGTFSAIGQSLSSFFTPWRQRFSSTASTASTAERAEAEQHEFVRRLKDSMLEGSRGAK